MLESQLAHDKEFLQSRLHIVLKYETFLHVQLGTQFCVNSMSNNTRNTQANTSKGHTVVSIPRKHVYSNMSHEPVIHQQIPNS